MNEKNRIGPMFVEMTKYPYLSPSAQQQGRPSPPIVKPPDPNQEILPLPPPDQAGSPICELIENRASTRSYAGTPLSNAELSFLLWATQGIKRYSQLHTLRTVPSAGARHAFESFVLANRVQDIAPGLYRYLPLEPGIQPFNTDPGVKEEMARICLGQRMVSDCAAAFIWTAVVERMAYRYGQRGYRYLYIDVGHVGQNLYLAGESIGCGVCAIAAFDDDRMNHALGLNGEDEFAIYLAVVGKKK